MDQITDILKNTALKSNMIHKHACLITYRNKILTTGYNHYKIWNGKIYNDNYGNYESNKYSIHAEKDAIQKIKNKNILKYCKIYVIRITDNIDNTIENSCSCNMCSDLIKKYKLQPNKLKFN